MKDSLPPISMVNPMQPGRQGIPIREREYGVTTSVRVVIENSKGSWPGNTVYNCPSGEHCAGPALQVMSPFGQGRWIDIGSGGPKDVSFKIESNDWITVEPNHGQLKRDATKDLRLRVSVDWSKVPSDDLQDNVGHIHIFPSDGFNVTVDVPIQLHDTPPKGHYVEADGYVAIEASHFARNTSEGEYAFQEIKGYGRTLSGLEMFPMTTQNFTSGEGPCLEYDFWTYSSESRSPAHPDEIVVQIGPALNFLGVNKTLAFGVQLDDHPVKIINPIPTEPLGFYQANPEMKPVAIGAVPKDWIDIVKEEIRNVRLGVDTLSEDGKLQTGQHTLRIWGMTTGLVFERVLVDLGGIRARPSFLGPPESQLAK
jgi:tetrahydromethanopterin S-methyltransferase subunit F